MFFKCSTQLGRYYKDTKPDFYWYDYLGSKHVLRPDLPEEALVEVVGLDGLRRHRRRRDVVDEDRACDKPCWGLDDDLDDYQPACAECPIS